MWTMKLASAQVLTGSKVILCGAGLTAQIMPVRQGSLLAWKGTWWTAWLCVLTWTMVFGSALVSAHMQQCHIMRLPSDQSLAMQLGLLT